MTKDPRAGKRFGVFVPYTNTNLEQDLALLCPPGVSTHVVRLGGYDEDEIPDESQMAGFGSVNLDEPLRLLMGVKPDVVLYGCTSATLAHGPGFDRALAREVAAQSGAATVTAAGAIVHALRQLGVTRYAFSSPYVPMLNDRAINFLTLEGFDCVGRADVEAHLSNDGQGGLTPDDVFALGLRADTPEAEALVLSCTELRAVEAIARLEDTLGKPVVTSNQALMFQAMQVAGLKRARPGYGRLFDRL